MCNKSRSMLTMVGICIGAMSVVIISTISATGTNEVNSQLINMGIDSVMVQVNKNVDDVVLSDEDIDEIKNISGVKDAMPLMSSITQSYLLNYTVDCVAWGIDKSADELISLKAKYGRLITNHDILSNSKVAVIDENIALQSYGRGNVVGKKVRIFLGGTFHEYEIVGVAESGITNLQSILSNIVPSFVYIPYSTMQMDTGRKNFDQIAVKLKPSEDNEQIISTVESHLNNIYNKENAISAYNLLQQKGQLESIMDMITIVLSSIAGISLVVSGLSVMTAMLASVSERRREIGIKKSIGAKNSDIYKEFISESLILSLTGSAVGIAFSILFLKLIAFLFRISIVFDWQIIMILIVSSAVIGIIFGAYPARKAAKMEPVKALH
ncbi:MAG: FtsX-like permease family protein [Clostridiales bacterium]|nr:FtsX-like permease family protein [Clostridiales bacterium]